MNMFTAYTPESAPAASRRAMAAVEAKQGYLPAAVGLLAESPETLEGFLRLSATFDSCTLDPLARETVIMTVAARNGCHLCLAMHAARLAALGADPSLAAALRAQGPLADGRLGFAQGNSNRMILRNRRRYSAGCGRQIRKAPEGACRVSRCMLASDRSNC